MTEKCKITYRRRNFEGLAPLTAEARTIAAPILGKHGFVGIDILTHWEEIVGADLARGIHPQKLTFDGNKRADGTLHVLSAGGAFAMLFEHQKSRVLERINTYFGYPAVARFKIRQGSFHLKPEQQQSDRALSPDETAALSTRIAGIEDSELREHLYRIGTEILRKKA